MSDRDEARVEQAPGGAVRRPVANALTVVGGALVVLGSWSILRAFGLVPTVVADIVDDWWPLVLVLGGGWLLARGRRASGTVLLVLGAVLLVISMIPRDLVGPVLLIGAGILLLLAATGGRRWLLGGPGVALFDDARTSRSDDEAARSFVAVFGESSGDIDAGVAEEGVVECLAVFGDVEVRVPRDVAVELRQTAVFGDVRAPQPPPVPTVATVQVRATAVFGDVRIDRA